MELGILYFLFSTGTIISYVTPYVISGSLVGSPVAVAVEPWRSHRSSLPLDSRHLSSLILPPLPGNAP